MKRFLLMLFSVLAMFGALSLQAQQAEDFCTDCVHYFVLLPSNSYRVTQASCCTADVQGNCFTGDWMVYQNVGHGCRMTAPDADGATRCENAGTDPNCGVTTGPDGKKTGYTTWGCVYDEYGYCDASCSSCAMT